MRIEPYLALLILSLPSCVGGNGGPPVDDDDDDSVLDDDDSTSGDDDDSAGDDDDSAGDDDDDSAGDDGLYRPDNGPSHEGGTVVEVSSEDAILLAIASASPGDVITVNPGEYDFNQRIDVQQDGEDSARIFLRAEQLGTVTFNLSHIENFKVNGAFWVFENIVFLGVCTDNSGCEHAFHLVGDADDTIIRNSEIVNFASHVKLNGEVLGAGPAKSFPDRAMFIDNFWHNTRYLSHSAPHNILNLDGGQGHIVRGNLFADYSAPSNVPRSASAVYPKASALQILIEQNLIVCERVRTDGETTRGIHLGDGAPATICDGDVDGDGLGDCDENGQSQEALVRNNIMMNCNNGGSSAGIMVASDRGSRVYHNTVYNTGQRNAGFFVGDPAHSTYWRYNVLENGFNTNYAEGVLDAEDNIAPSFETMNTTFTEAISGDFSLLDGGSLQEQAPTDSEATHDFCGYPRGATADLGAIEYSTPFSGSPCVEQVQQMFDRIP